MLNVDIHPTAILHETARLAPKVRIGPYAVIGANVTLETGVSIGTGSLIGDDALQPPSWNESGTVVVGEFVSVGAYCRVTGQVSIGANTEVFDGCRLRGPLDIGAACQIYDGVAVGNPGQFPGHHIRNGRISIGQGTVLREGVTITQPVLTNLTGIGAGCYLMARTQIDHDCILERGVKTGTGVTLGGAVHVDRGAYLGMNAVLHQKTVVGANTMIGMNGVVLRHVPPYAVLVNRRFTKINRRGLELLGWKEEVLSAIEAFYRDAGTLPANSDDDWVEPVRAFFDRIGDASFETFSGS
jgi:UDP-N-acetylglucosamine acyltransferase